MVYKFKEKLAFLKEKIRRFWANKKGKRGDYFYQKFLAIQIHHYVLTLILLLCLFLASNFWYSSDNQLDEEYLDFISSENHRQDIKAEAATILINTYQRKTVTSYKDSLEDLFAKLDIQDVEAADFIKQQNILYSEIVGRSNRYVDIETGPSNKIYKMVVRFNKGSDEDFQRYTLVRSKKGFNLKHEILPLQVKRQVVSGVIKSSLFATTDELNLPDAFTIQLAEIFSSYIDFYSSLRQGDYFAVAYDALLADGIVLSAGKIKAAEFVNRGRQFSAVWFAQDKAGKKGEYFTFDGEGRKRTYLKAPLKFSRISSRFTTARFHPILKKWKGHKGVDYAAPTGTPIRAIADGVVDFSGVQRGYGNVVYIKHPDKNISVYAHMSKIMAKKGAKIMQGDSVGLVGMTGWATGPHLHFEIRVKGVHVDPLTIVDRAMPNYANIKNNKQFLALSAKLQQLLKPYAAQAKEQAEKMLQQDASEG